MCPIKWFKAKQDLAVVPVLVDEIASNSHKGLAKKGGSAIQCDRELTTHRKFLKKTLLSFLD
jgi:hypothetical protein